MVGGCVGVTGSMLGFWDILHVLIIFFASVNIMAFDMMLRSLFGAISLG